jgi:hypothetical protein
MMIDLGMKMAIGGGGRHGHENTHVLQWYRK